MNQSPYEPTKAPLIEQCDPGVRWGKALAVWWSAGWRAALYSIPGGFLLGAVGGVIATISGVPEKAQIYGAIGGYVASIPLSMFAMKQALSKHLASLVADHRRDVA